MVKLVQMSCIKKEVLYNLFALSKCFMILLDVEGGPSNELDKKIVQLQQEVALIEEEIKEKVNLLNN